jgi:GAF domain-containing protein
MSSENINPPSTPSFWRKLISPHASIGEIGARRQAQLLAIFSLIVAVLLIAGAVASYFIGQVSSFSRASLIMLILLTILAYAFSRTRLFHIGSILLTASMASSAYLLILNGEDPQRSLLSTVPMALILGSVLLSFGEMAVLVGAIVISTGLIGVMAPGTETRTVIVAAGSFFSMGAAFLAAIRFRDSVEKQRVNEVQANNRDLQSLRLMLEQRVEERTASLEQRNHTLQTLTEFIGHVSLASNEDNLISEAIRFLSDRLKLDHLGIFLVDDAGEYAVLNSTSSDVGKSLIDNHYRLRISKTELTHLFSETDIMHVEVGGEDFRISRPVTLPDMKTNVSFPLVAGSKLIGLINIQTITSNPEYLEKGTLQTLSDQFALSLQNIRLLSELQGRLGEISQLAGTTVKASWERILGGGTLGFNYDRLHVLPTGETFPKEMNEKLLAGQSVTYLTEEDISRARLVAPIVLRDEVIGIIGYEDEDPRHEWQSEEKVLLETIASRVSLALENSRLLSEAQQRAERERIVGQVTGRIRETLDIDTVLRTAVQEMRQSLGLRQAEVRLQAVKETGGKKA